MPLQITTGTQKVATTLETETVGVTDLDITTVQELESTAPVDGVTIPLEPEKTFAAIEISKVSTTEIAEITQPDMETETADITTKLKTTDITEVVTDVVLTTGALDTTEATEVVTETVPLQITTGTQKVATTLEMETVGVTDVNMTTMVDMTDDDMKNIISLEFKGITVSKCTCIHYIMSRV